MSRQALALVPMAPSAELPLPIQPLIAGAGRGAAFRFLEFFPVTILMHGRLVRFCIGATGRGSMRWAAFSLYMWPRVSSNCRLYARLPRPSNIWLAFACCLTGL